MRRMRCITLAILFMLFVVLSSSVMSISRAAGMKPANALAPIKGRDSVMVEVDSQGGVIFLLYSLPAPMLKELDEAFNGKKMKRIILGNAPNRANEGEPVLPVVPSQVIIPYGMTISKIDVKMGKKIALSGEHFIEYGKPVYPLIPDAQIKKGGPSDAIYGSDNAFPGKTHNFVSLQKKYGVSVAIVNLNPITYSPKSGKVYYYEDISLIIVTKPDSSNGKSKIRIRPEKFDPLQVGIENPEALDSYGGEWQESTIPFGTFNPLDSYQYVLITSEAIDDADTDVTVHDLIAQKQSRGLTAIIVTIEDIYDSFPGVDNAEKLRNAIIWYYNNWETDYVLLGGDINIIPMRKLWCQAYAGGDVDNIPSDLYFQCLDGSYNSDGDSRWGEPNDGQDIPGGNGDVDLMAELFIGRASAENAEEMSNFVYKTIAYENESPAEPYLRHALMVGEHLGFGGDSEYAKPSMEEIRLGSDAHGYTTAGFAACPLFTVDTLYDADGTWPKSEIIGDINSNEYSIFNHLGHANDYYVMKFYNADADALTNTNFLFAYSQGCIPGNFEVDCIGEHLTTTHRHGMFAVVFNSRYGWGTYNSTDGPSQRFDRQFWDAYFGEYILNLGAMNASSHEDNISDINGDCMRWCYYESNLLGDPHTTIHGLAIGPSLAYDSHTHDDSVGGNADGIINPGEEIDVTVTLINIGSEDAIGVSALLSTEDEYITITDDSAEFGDIACCGALKEALDSYTCEVSPSCPTPHTATLELLITDSDSGSWSSEFTITVYTSSQISGQVTIARTGEPIEGATVEYSGPMSGSVETNIDGNYMFGGIDGTYVLRASFPEYLPPDPQEVTVPPDADNINFEMRRPEISVDPESFSETLDLNNCVTRTLLITNSGDADLEFYIEIEASDAPTEVVRWKGPQVPQEQPQEITPEMGFEVDISTLSHEITPLALVPYPFYDGFESGNYDNWTPGGGAYERFVTSDTAARGMYSFSQIGGSYTHYDGVSAHFAEGVSPEEISFSVRSGSSSLADGYFVLRSDGYCPIFFYMTNTGNIYANYNTSYPYSANTWYDIKFEIDWELGNFNLYVNDELVSENIPFRDRVSSFTTMYLYNFYNSQAWYDEINIGGRRWLSVEPASGTVTPDKPLEVEVTFCADNLLAGTYEGSLDVFHNAPTEPNPKSVPCELIVNPLKLLEVSPTSHDFEIVWMDTCKPEIFTLTNNGNETTTVSAIDIDNAEFSHTATLPLEVPASGSVTFEAQFCPVDEGSETALMTITSDADDNPDLEVSLAGTGVRPPEIEVDPSSFEKILDPGDSVTDIMTITNNGGDYLEFDIACIAVREINELAVEEKLESIRDDIRSQYKDDNVRSSDSLPGDVTAPAVASESILIDDSNVLIFRDQLAWGLDVNVPLLEALGATVSIARSSDMSSIDLSPYDLVVFESSQPISFYNTYIAHLNKFESYLQSGGVIQFHCATYYSPVPNLPFPGGMQTLSYSDFDFNNYIEDSDHPIVKGAYDPLYGGYASHESFENLPPDATIIVVNGSGRPTTVEYRVGAGTLIATGMTWEIGYAYGWNSADPLLPNAFAYSLSISRVDWLSVDPESGNVPPGSSMNINVTFDATGLFADIYNANLNINHNGTNEPTPLEVPCELTVTSRNRLDVSPSTHDFGEVFIGGSRTVTLTLNNTGNEETRVEDIFMNCPAFNHNADTPVFVEPFGSVTFEAQFLPMDLGPQQCILSILSDADDNPELTVELNGTGIPAPEAELDPDSLTFTFNPFDPPADQISILSNQGGSPLTWEITLIEETCNPLGVFTKQGFTLNNQVHTDLIYNESNYRNSYIVGRVIVGLQEGTLDFADTSILSRIGVNSIRELATAKKPGTGLPAYTGRKLLLLFIDDQTEQGVIDAINELKKDPNVAYAEPDYVVEAINTIPNDPYFDLLWGMHNEGQTGGTPDADIDAPEAWDKHTGNGTVLVGVIDTGIDYNHPDLAGNMWVNPGEIPDNGIDDEGNGYIDDIYGWDFCNNDNNPWDDHYHGTHCAGTIAATGDNNEGVVGVIWNAQLVALKFLNSGGSGTTTDAIDAVDYSIAMDIPITSNSWGGGGYSQALKDMIDDAGEEGYLFVAAAGNTGQNTDIYPHYPASYDCENIISVAMTDHNDQLDGRSCFGPTSVDLGAPGVNIYSCAPYESYRYLDGTSMATPHVSGAAALIWSYNKFLSGEEVKDILLASVGVIPSLTGKVLTDGRLNINQAIEEAGVSWLSALPMGPGILYPGQGEDITVNVNPEGLTSGQWCGRINFATNDPLNPEPSIAVTVNINGCKSLSVDPSFHDFGEVWVGRESSFTITLENKCNDVATVSLIEIDNVEFSHNVTPPLLVPPFDSVTFEAYFVPTNPGKESCTMSITSDADDNPLLTVDLVGEGINPPEIEIDPESFLEALGPEECLRRRLEIRNDGDDDLEFNISPIAVDGLNALAVEEKLEKIRDDIRSQYKEDNARSSASLPGDVTAPAVASDSILIDDSNVLIFRDQLAWGLDVNVPLLEALGAIVSIARSSDMSSIDLSPYNLVVFESSQPISFYNTYIANLSRFESYLQSGGVIQFHCATYYSPVPNLPFPGGMQTLSYSDFDSYNYIEDADHPIVEGAYDPLYGNYASHESFENLPPDATIIVVNGSGRPTTVEYKVGAGTLIATGMPWEWNFYFGNNSGDPLLPNAFEYSLSIWGLEWLTVEPTSGTIEPGEEIDIDLEFCSDELPPDTYKAILNINHNALNEENPLPVSCRLVVLSVKELEVIPENHNFGDVYLGECESQTWTLCNGGNDDTTISSIDLDCPEFSHNADLPLVVPARGCVTFEGAFCPADLGAETCNMIIHSDANEDPEIEVRLEGNGVALPEISVDPYEFSWTLPPGEIFTDLLLITNSGNAELEYFISLVGNTLSHTISAHELYDETHFEAFPKDVQDTRVGSPVVLNHGGPDTFGYIWADSDEPTAPVEYEWEDISSMGTRLNISNCDDCYTMVNLCSPFKFYGNEFSEIYVSSNGFITLGAGNISFINFPLPSTTAPSNLIAGFWDDLDPGDGGEIYFYDFGDKAVIQFDNVVPNNGIGSYTFQMVLYYKDGFIRCYYNDMTGSVTTATVGIQNEAKDDGLTVVYNAEYLKNSLAVEFRVISGWLSVDPHSGDITPGESPDEVSVIVDTHGRDEGPYGGELLVYHNDPRSEHPIPVPCALTVVGMNRLSVSPTSHDFGAVAVGACDTIMITLENTGNYDTMVNALEMECLGFIHDEVPLPLVVPAFESVSFEVRFCPVDIGPESCTMTIYSDAADNPELYVDLSGEGINPPCRIAVDPDHFEEMAYPGQIVTQTLLISNTAAEGADPLHFEISILEECMRDPEPAGIEKSIGTIERALLDETGSVKEIRDVDNNKIPLDNIQLQNMPVNNKSLNNLPLGNLLLDAGRLNLGKVVNSFPGPCEGFMGLEWIHGNLWVSCINDQMLYGLNPVDGTIIGQLALPEEIHPSGFTFDGAAFWVCDPYTDKIHKVDTTGTILQSFALPYGGPVGLAWDGESLWNVDWTTARLYMINPADGSIVHSIPAPDTRPAGVAWDGRYLWTNGRDSGTTYRIDPLDGAVISSFVSPPPGSPSGQCVAFDGTFLWVSTSFESRIYQIDVEVWLSVDPPIGDIDPGETAEIRVIMDATHLLSGDYCRSIKIEHDCEEELPIIVPCNLAVTGGTISGRIVDCHTSDPLAGIHVYAWGIDAGYFSTETDQDGRYTLKNLPPDCYEVRAGGNGYAWKYYDDTYDWRKMTPVCVEPAQDVTGIDFALDCEGKISGRITDGVNGIQVYVSAYDSGLNYGRGTMSNPDGTYTITELAPSENYKIHAGGNGFAWKYYEDTYDYYLATPVPVNMCQHITGIDMILEEGVCISGRVTDGGNGIEVIVVAINESLGYGWGIWSNPDDGTYTICDLPPGDYSLQAGENGYCWKYYDNTYNWEQRTIIHADSGEHITDIDFTLDLCGSISGTVTDGNDGIYVNVHAWDESTGISFEIGTAWDGSYTFHNVPCGNYIVHAGGNGFAWKYYDNTYYKDQADPVHVCGEDVTEIDFVLECAGAISGTVTDEGTGLPIEGSTVCAFDYETDDEIGCTVTDSSGYYFIGDLPPVDYRVHASAHGYDPEYYDNTKEWEDANPVTVRPCQETPDIDFALQEIPEDCPPAPVIIDNGDPGTSFTGTWSISKAPNPWEEDSLFSVVGGSTYSYCASAEGSWEISLWWTEWPSRCTDVPVEIYDGDILLTTHYVDQTRNGGKWNVLGTYEFTGTARIVITHIAVGECNTCADAVRIDEEVPPPPEKIIDNGDPETSFTGTWPVSSGPNPWDEDSLYNNEPGSTYSYEFTTTGSWEISIWWTEMYSRCTDVPVDIYDGDVWLATHYVNQTQNGGRWNVLGTYEFSTAARIVINSISSECYTCADAVKFSESAPPPPEVIIDNGDPETSFTGTWRVSSGPNPWDEDSLYNNEPGSTYSYEFTTTGSWEISIWWTEMYSRCTNVPVDIYDGDVWLATHYVDQTQNGGRWNALGTYEFSTTARIVINSYSSECYTCADAVKFSESASPPPELIIDNGDPETSFIGNWRISSGPNPWEENSLYSLEPNATYSYEVSAIGLREISLWWTVMPSRCTNVPIEIYDGAVLRDIKYVDQTIDGGQWNMLGIFEFSGTARIVINSSSNECNTCADVVRIAVPKSPPPEIIIDNGDSVTSYIGNWRISSGPDPWEESSLYSIEPSAIYSYTASAVGLREISLWWTEMPSRCKNVPIEIYNGLVLIDTIYVDQTIDGGRWNVLGIYEFDSTVRIVINSTSINGCNTCTDAVKVAVPPPS